MSEEEMNRKMEFIVEQQAKFAADIEITREVQAADAKLLKEETKLLKEQDRVLSNAMIGLVDIVGNLTRAQTETDQNIKRLTEAQTRTDARLNILIEVVDRHISGNGGSTNPA